MGQAGGNRQAPSAPRPRHGGGGRLIGGKPQASIIEDFASFVAPGRVAVYRALGFDAVPGRREGVYVWDLEGRRYVNCRSSGGVFNLGHRPAAVVAALKEALDFLDIGDHMLLSE
ncbi:MAG: hypothetical protein ACM3X4_11090, partial [Ignavibacteriales bacterium]